MTSTAPVRNELPPSGDALQTARFRLDEAIVAQANDRNGWARNLNGAVAELVAAIQAHREAADGPDGTLARLAMRKPRFGHQARAQEVEHAILLREAAALEATILAQVSGDAVNVSELRNRSSILLERLRDHIATSTDLIYEANFSDIGGES